MSERTAEQILLDNGYEDVVIFSGTSYDSALIGVSDDHRAVYDYDRMAEWLMVHENMTEEEALDWIDYNTLSSLPHDDRSPIVVYRLLGDDEKC